MKSTKNIPIAEGNDEIKIPKIRYKQVAYVEASDKVFNGDITPIPSILIEYLNKTELQTFALILKQIRDHGYCIMRIETMKTYLGMSHVSLANTMSKLKSMGIINYDQCGKRKNRTINFDAIQKLQDLLKGRKPGAAPALRKRIKSKDISKLSEADIKFIDTYYTWHDDPDEDEEYD